jgi:hypothetical protein
MKYSRATTYPTYGMTSLKKSQNISTHSKIVKGIDYEIIVLTFFLAREITKTMGQRPTLLFFRKFVRYIYK